MEFAKHPVQFFTAVCYDWLKLLGDDACKQLIIDALKFRISRGEVKVGAFVIMPNHIHLIWRLQNKYALEDAQRDFLKFTAKEIIDKIKSTSGERELESLYVGLIDRKFQVWKRNSMSIDLRSESFFKQKMKYIHDNPCQPHWNLASHPIDYRFSSARFYELGEDEFGLITHVDEL
jgi:putative transposase